MICPRHGDVGCATEWVPCSNGCQDGYFDGYEDDPLWYDEGDFIKCDACGGDGGHMLCTQCIVETEPDEECYG